MSVDTIDIKAEIRERKRLRKLGLLPDPAPLAPPAESITDPDLPAKRPGRTWSCRVCKTQVQAVQIPAGWLSVARWPADRERHLPITTVFCSPTCATEYLVRITGLPLPTFPAKRKAAA